MDGGNCDQLQVFTEDPPETMQTPPMRGIIQTPPQLSLATGGPNRSANPIVRYDYEENTSYSSIVNVEERPTP